MYPDSYFSRYYFEIIIQGVYVPPLPLRKIKAYDDYNIKNRLKFLENFLNECLKQPEFKNS